MDPITPNLIAGLAVEAVRGVGGRLKRSGADPVTLSRLIDQILGKSRANMLQILAELEAAPADDQYAVAEFLRSPAFSNVSRVAALAVFSNVVDETNAKLVDQLSALLCLGTRIPQERATNYAKLVSRITTSQCSIALDLLKRVDPDEYSFVREQLAVEVAAGKLRTLEEQTKAITAVGGTDAESILAFADEYVSLIHSMTSEIIPAYFDTQKRVPIDSIYVAPRLSPDEPRAFGIDEGDSDEEDVEEDYYEHDAETAPAIDIETLLQRAYRLVVLGDPGAGKSTLGQRIVYDLTAVKPSENPAGRIPFVVTLRRYEEHKRTRSSSIVQYLEDVLREDYHLTVPPNALKFLFATARATVVFDGLDELLETHRRREIAASVEAFGIAHSTTNIIVTSRIVGYREAPLNPKVYRAATLLGFSPTEVEEYAEKWFNLDDRLAAREKERVTEAFVEESASVSDLRSNPLMLGLLCNVYRGERSIPRDRADLYDQCARMLFERWDASRGIHSATNVLKADARSALQGVALWIFSEQRTADEIPEPLLTRRIAKHWMSDRHEQYERAQEEAELLLASWRGRAWVLTDVGLNPRGERLYKFTHQTFLEYFASQELVRRNPSPRRLWAVLKNRIAAGEWDIVAQLSVQMLNRSYGGATNQIYEQICVYASADHGLKERQNMLSFGARYLDVLLPSPRVCRALVDCAVDLALDGQMKSYLPMMPDGTLQIHKNASTSAWDAEESAEEMLKPLIVAIEAQGHIAEIVADEVPRHCATLLSYPETAPSAAAYVLLRNLDEIDYLTSAATPSLFANPTVQEVIDATADVVKSRLSEWSKENVRAGLTAWFHSVIGFERLTSLIPASAIYMSAPRVIHQGLDDLVVATPGHAILAALTGKGVNRAKRSDARKALAILGEKFSSYEPPYFGGRVFDMDDLRSEIVQPYFRTGISVVESPELETSIREKAAHLPRNVAFGGAVLLGAIIENEEWSLVDESEDQIAFLSLGLLQSLEMLFVARTEPGMYFAMRSVVDRAGFTEEQRRVLLGWAEREVDFTIFS